MNKNIIIVLVILPFCLFMISCGSIREAPYYSVTPPAGVEIVLGDTVAYAAVYDTVLREHGWDSGILLGADTNPAWLSMPDTTDYSGVFYEITNLLYSDSLGKFVFYTPSHIRMRLSESVIPNLVNDAMLFFCKTRLFTQTHIFFNTGGNIRTNNFTDFIGIEAFDGEARNEKHYIPLGETITPLIQGQIDSYNNTTDALRLTGRMLKDVFEHSVSALPSTSGAFAHFSGAKIEVDISGAPGIGGNRIKKISVYTADDTDVWNYYKRDTGWDTVYDSDNGGWQAPYSETYEFYVGVSTYHANGGDNYTPLLAAPLGAQSTMRHVESYTYYFDYYKSIFGETAPIVPIIDGRYLWH